MKREIKNKCKKCGYEWNGWKKDPKSCPECKSREWNKNGI
jgi:predicted Zn-ribbon and HTH transcriptional regulator